MQAHGLTVTQKKIVNHFEFTRWVNELILLERTFMR